MLELLSGTSALILKNAHIFETAIALQILDPLCHQAQKLFQFSIARIPQMALMIGVFQQKLVRSDRSHAVIQAIAPPTWFAFDPIDGRGMYDRTRRPCSTIHAGQRCDHLQLRGLAAKRAWSGAGDGFRDIITRNHPRTGDGIFAEFHE